MERRHESLGGPLLRRPHRGAQHPVPHNRLHPADCNGDISISISRTSTVVKILSSGRGFNTQEISSVWFRRPDSIDFASRHLQQPDRHLVIQETNATLWGLYGRMDAVWISHPYNLRWASWKVFQLEVCSRVGMQCPSYVVSNDAGVLKQFAESYDELVLKPLHERTTCFESDGKLRNLCEAIYLP